MDALVAADELFVQQLVGQMPWGRNRLVVEYALGDMSKPIGVSEYFLSGGVRDGVVPSLPDPFATAYRRWRDLKPSLVEEGPKNDNAMWRMQTSQEIFANHFMLT